MRPTLLMLSIGLVLNGNLFAQRVIIVAQAGISSYASASIGGFGGGGVDRSWRSGPIVGIGASIALSDVFSAGATVEYSSHQHKYPGYGIHYDAANRILDLNGIGRIRFGLFDPFSASIFGGIGLSHQKRDPTDTPGRSELDVGSIIGVGLAAELSKRVEVFLDGSWRIRVYVTPVAQIGIAYAL